MTAHAQLRHARYRALPARRRPVLQRTGRPVHAPLPYRRRCRPRPPQVGSPRLPSHRRRRPWLPAGLPLHVRNQKTWTRRRRARLRWQLPRPPRQSPAIRRRRTLRSVLRRHRRIRGERLPELLSSMSPAAERRGLWPHSAFRRACDLRLVLPIRAPPGASTRQRPWPPPSRCGAFRLPPDVHGGPQRGVLAVNRL